MAQCASVSQTFRKRPVACVVLQQSARSYTQPCSHALSYSRGRFRRCCSRSGARFLHPAPGTRRADNTESRPVVQVRSPTLDPLPTFLHGTFCHGNFCHVPRVSYNVGSTHAMHPHRRRECSETVAQPCRAKRIVSVRCSEKQASMQDACDTQRPDAGAHRHQQMSSIC